MGNKHEFLSCQNLKKNLKQCSCSYASCDNKGLCCKCVAYHRKKYQLPGCFFTPEIEQTYDRSFRSFCNNQKK